VCSGRLRAAHTRGADLTSATVGHGGAVVVSADLEGDNVTRVEANPECGTAPLRRTNLIQASSL